MLLSVFCLLRSSSCWRTIVDINCSAASSSRSDWVGGGDFTLGLQVGTVGRSEGGRGCCVEVRAGTLMDVALGVGSTTGVPRSTFISRANVSAWVVANETGGLGWLLESLMDLAVGLIVVATCESCDRFFGMLWLSGATESNRSGVGGGGFRAVCRDTDDRV